jgi:hypothetical protein
MLRSLPQAQTCCNPLKDAGEVGSASHAEMSQPSDVGTDVGLPAASCMQAYVASAAGPAAQINMYLMGRVWYCQAGRLIGGHSAFAQCGHGGHRLPPPGGRVLLLAKRCICLYSRLSIEKACRRIIPSHELEQTIQIAWHAATRLC